MIRFSGIRIKSLLCLALIAATTTACTNTTNLNSSNLTNVVNTLSNSNFAPRQLENQVIGNWESFSIRLGAVSSEEGFSSEKAAIKAILSLQEHFLGRVNDYAIVQDNNLKYYIYQINAASGTNADARDLKSYGDLRNVNILNPLSEAQVLGIASSQGKFRFFTGEPTTENFSLINSPEEAIISLKKMEAALVTAQDHRGLFTVMYRVITERAYQELLNYRKTGNLKAAAFEEKLMVNFANRYFEAYDNYSLNKISSLSEVWRMSFDSGRKSQALGLHESGNIPEIIALAMNAHIIHDLPLTLKTIGYDVHDPELKATFDRFNTVLFEEKDNILNAIKKAYGKNIVQDANDFFGTIGSFTMQKIFSVMRGIASNQAVYFDEQSINRTSIAFGDGIQQLIPGGNSVKR